MSIALSRLVQFNTINVLGIFRKEDSQMCYLLTVKKKKSSLNILHISQFGYDDLVKSINSKFPVLLVVDGKAILNKQIDLHNETDVNWKKTVDYNALYYTELETSANSFISICRKPIVDELITDVVSKGLQVIDFYLGPLLAFFVKSAIPKNEIIINDSILEFSNENLVRLIKSNSSQTENYLFEDKELSCFHIPLYGAAVHFFTQNPAVSKSNSSQINVEEIIYKKVFKIYGLVLLVTFLLSLLTSYFLIQYYSSKNFNLNQQNVYMNQTYQHIEKLEEQIQKKLEILNETGQLSKNFLSFYCYDLLKSTPSAITVEYLDVFPLSKEIKGNKKVEIESNSIVLKGTTATEAEFNNWLNKLRSMKWIKKFEIISFKIDKKNNKQYELKIHVTDV